MDTLRATVFGDPKLYGHSKMLHMNQLEIDYSYIHYFLSVSYSLAEFPRIFFVLSNLLSTIAGFYRTFPANIYVAIGSFDPTFLNIHPLNLFILLVPSHVRDHTGLSPR